MHMNRETIDAILAWAGKTPIDKLLPVIIELMPKGPQMKLKQGTFLTENEPPLFVGNRVCLNSGSPIMLVVEIKDDAIVVSWRDTDGETHEAAFPEASLYRIG